MMNFIISMMLFVRLLVAMMPTITTENSYALYTRVLCGDGNITVFEDDTGNTWSAYCDIPEGKDCILIMDNNNTEEITDDIITQILLLAEPYDFNGNIELIDGADITADKLAKRNGAIIIEFVIGRVVDADGNGVVINTTNEDYNYISYRETGLNEGDFVETYLIHAPNGSDVDEIIGRFDFRYEGRN